MFGKRLINTGGVSCTTDTLQILGDMSCVATYRLNGNATDLSGNYNGTATDVTYDTGQFGEAGFFNGSSSIINITSTSTEPLNVSSGTFSVSMWINMSNLTNNNKLIYKWGTSPSLRSILWTVTTSGFLYVVEGTTLGDTLMLGTTEISTNNWVHIAITREQDGNLIQYINGVPTDTFSTENRTFETNSEPIYIGYQDGQTTNFNGSIDQVRIFNKAITEAEVTTLYNEVAC